MGTGGKVLIAVGVVGAVVVATQYGKISQALSGTPVTRNTRGIPGVVGDVRQVVDDAKSITDDAKSIWGSIQGFFNTTDDKALGDSGNVVGSSTVAGQISSNLEHGWSL